MPFGATPEPRTRLTELGDDIQRFPRRQTAQWKELEGARGRAAGVDKRELVLAGDLAPRHGRDGGPNRAGLGARSGRRHRAQILQELSAIRSELDLQDDGREWIGLRIVHSR